MAIFNTERPTNAYEEAIKLARLRKQNMRALDKKYIIESSAESEKVRLEKEAPPDNSEIEHNSELSRIEEKIANESLKRSLLSLESRLVTEGYDLIVNNILFEVAYHSFWLDDNMKESALDSLSESFNETINFLESINIPRVKPLKESQLLKNIKGVALEAAKKTAKRIADEASETCSSKDDVDDIDFSMNDEEIDDLDNNLSELGKEDIEELVKMKVLNVIADEKRVGERKAEILQELDDEIANSTDDSTADDTTDDNTESEESPAKESVMVSAIRRKRLKMLNNEGSSLFESIMIGSSKGISQVAESQNISLPTENRMDAVFSNAVFTYTVLETLNTLGIYNIGASEARKIAKEYSK